MNKTTIIACCASVIAGGYVTHLYYSAEIAGMQRKQAEAVQKEQTTHAAKLAAATDTILLAQSEYDAVRSELDRALGRLRNAPRGKISLLHRKPGDPGPVATSR